MRKKFFLCSRSVSRESKSTTSMLRRINLPPEAADYPDNLKGSEWLASDLIFIVGAWNANNVKKNEEPKQFEDFADPKWKGRLIAEPRDAELLIALTQKHKSQEKAVAILRKMQANNIEFHKGHSQLAELLVAGRGGGGGG